MAELSYSFHFINKVVLPGSIVGEKIRNREDVGKKIKLKLGPGLRIDKDNIIAYKCGVLREKENTMFWIDTDQKRVFIPSYSIFLCSIINYAKYSTFINEMFYETEYNQT